MVKLLINYRKSKAYRNFFLKTFLTKTKKKKQTKKLFNLKILENLAGGVMDRAFATRTRGWEFDHIKYLVV